MVGVRARDVLQIPPQCQLLGIRHLNEMQSSDGGEADPVCVCVCVCVYGGCLAVSTELPAKTVMESRRGLALCRNYLSLCQDFTVYPHEPSGRI